MGSSKDGRDDERQPLLGDGSGSAAAAAGPSGSRGQQQQQQQHSSSSTSTPFLAPLASPGHHHHQQEQDAQYQAQHQPASATSTGGPTFSRDLYPVYNDPFRPENILQAKQRARRRFALTLVLGFLTWTMLGLLVGVIGGEGAGFFGGPRRPSHARWPGALPGDPALDGNITSAGCADFLRTLPIQAIVVGPPAMDGAAARGSVTESEEGDGNSLHRETGSGGPPYTIYRSKAYFHFGLTEEDGIFLLGRGRFSSGSVRYILEEPKSSHARDNITDPALHVVEVEVVAKWNDRELLRTAKVCPLVRRPNDTLAMTSESGIEAARVGAREYGIGIYTPEPDYEDQYRHLSFETVVRLPPTSSGLRALRSLSLRGPSFSPVELALSPMSFGRVHLNTSNGAVDVMPGFTLAAAHAEAHTSNGRIVGTFNVSDSLRLESSNGPIEASVNLVPVQPEDGSPSRIDVVARTTNGRVGLKYLSHPNEVVLTSVAQSSNGEARVIHQPAFEGSYDLATSFGKGVVHAAEGTKDPAGLGRKRVVKVEKDDRGIGQTHQTGSVQWGKKETTDRLGGTIAHTSLGAATIDFL